MKTVHALVIVAATLSSGSATMAQTVPNQLIGGSVALAIGNLTLRSNCYVNRSPAFFQRNGTGTKAVITLDDITEGGTDLSGQSVLTFTSQTGGTIHFKQLPGLSDPPFTGYIQTTSADALKFSVVFTINFSDCSLPIKAVFDLT